jgi:hypothetical protein
MIALYLSHCDTAARFRRQGKAWLATEFDRLAADLIHQIAVS